MTRCDFVMLAKLQQADAVPPVVHKEEFSSSAEPSSRASRLGLLGFVGSGLGAVVDAVDSKVRDIVEHVDAAVNDT